MAHIDLARRVARNLLRTSPWRTLLALQATGKVAVGRRTRLLGARNVIVERGLLKLGTGWYSLADSRNAGQIKVRGRLICEGSVAVGQGAQWEIQETGVVRIGDGTYINTFSIMVITTSLTIGAGCAIAWQTQFLDDDMHTILVDGRSPSRSAPIVLEDDVWIGSRVTILKGTHVARGCVVASGAVLSGRFEEPNCLIGGIPARVLRRNVSWQAD
jgi:acetyltransferase-like isoleucine patch superfamily enzyme